MNNFKINYNMAKIVMYPADSAKEALDWKAVQGQHITAVERKVLVLGSGGREHALAWKLAQSEGAHVFIAPGNAGTAQVGTNVNLKLSDFESIKQLCLKEQINMVVVGPEQPLVDGIVDFFKNDGALKDVKIIGPDKRGAQLEGSKAYAKDFMEKYGIPTAKCFKVNKDNIEAGFGFLEQVKAPYVLKADGLAAGKGVLILNDLQEAKDELSKMLDGKFGAASATVVIEEFLKGIEVSVFVLTDGEHYVLLPEAKDYKRIGDGDTGLNTGGMGAVSPVPFCTPVFLDKVEERIVKPTLKGLKSEKIDYKGFIFLGLMNDGGNPYVIEYNRLNEVHYAQSEKTAVTVMMVSGGYPEAYRKGMKMSGLEGLKDVVAFHAGTTFDGDKQVVTSGGRVIAVTAHGDSIEEARGVAYREVEKIHFEGANYRHDIGLDLMKLQ